MNKYLAGVIMVATLTGCASSPDKMAATYVSPIQYQDYDCKQVGAELTRVSRRAQELYGQLDKTASNDAAQMAVGMVLFWPALFFLEGGDGPDPTQRQQPIAPGKTARATPQHRGFAAGAAFLLPAHSHADTRLLSVHQCFQCDLKNIPVALDSSATRDRP